MIVVPEWTNDPDDPDRHLIVISAPRRRHPKYWRHFDALIDFDIRLAEAIIGHDNVIVLASKAEMPFLRGKLPDDVLLEANLKDIWIRDFAPILATKMVQFVYRPRYLKPWGAAEASGSFASFCRRYGLKFERSKLVLDGGNLVSNHKDMAIVTERVLSDNPGWTQGAILAELKDKLGLQHVAIIPEEPGDVTGHADGMVSWPNDESLAVTLRSLQTYEQICGAIAHQLPSIATAQMASGYQPVRQGRSRAIASAVGCYANAVATARHLIVPKFDIRQDAIALQQYSLYSERPAHLVDAGAIAGLGGSVRCLSWQVTGMPAKQLVMASRAC
jgi:agmatine/peptidylarginine deiminase